MRDEEAVWKVLIKNVPTLSPRDRDVLTGLWVEHKTLKEVGDPYGVTRARVSQIEARARRKILVYLTKIHAI